MKKDENEVRIEQMSKELQELQEDITMLHRKSDQLESQFAEMDILQQQDRRLLTELKAIFQQGDMHATIDALDDELRANEKRLYMQMEDGLKQGVRKMRALEDRETELYILREQYFVGDEKE